MSTFNVGMRKYVEYNQLQYWLVINAKAAEGKKAETVAKTPKKFRLLINREGWRTFLVSTIICNCLGSSMFMEDKALYTYMILTHLTCFFYWIDFIASIVQIQIKKKRTGIRTRKGHILLIDAISLIPVSAVYLAIEPNPDKVTFTACRVITALRLHKVFSYFYNLSMSVVSHRKLMMVNHLIIFTVFGEFFLCYVLTDIQNYSPIHIHHWNETSNARRLVSIYYTVQVVFTVGCGDIIPVEMSQRLICIVVAILGCCQLGILAGVLTTAFSNSDKSRERYRDEYNATMKLLKRRKIDKRVIERVSENMVTMWKYKNGFTESADIQILPMSMHKEICFDINFGLLSKSLIFSTQPRSFLRSVSILMKNISYFPGDVIVEPFETTDAMLCVASGVIEVLSEENDETVLFSLTSGTILREATLFLSTPMRCMIRAATYVELQVLTKDHFSRLALKYPEIIRSMRSDIYYRLRFRNQVDVAASGSVDHELVEISRRKEIKRFLQELRFKKENVDERALLREGKQKAILGLYVISENIPMVKTLPVTLIRAKPWILRPGTTLMNVWEIFVILVVTSVVYTYPICTAFYHYIPSELGFYMIFVESVYIVDLYVSCTTAIQNRDSYTFKTSIKDIIAYKLKTFDFYMDIFAAYDFSVFAKFQVFEHHDSVTLLFSLNRVFKVWRIVVFFLRLEEDIRSVLLLVRTVKYLFFFSIAFVWGACIVYIEACPNGTCNNESWYASEEVDKIVNQQLNSISEWPMTLSFYFAISTLSGVSFGDIYPTSIVDCAVAIFLIITGVIIINLCMSETSATFNSISSVQLNYKAEVFAVDRYLSEHEIPKKLTEDIRDYLQLQWNYDQGMTLMESKTSERLPLQHRQIIIMELAKFFMAVPAFRNADIDFIKLLAKRSKVWLLPPDYVIWDIGSLEREMFILENGFCEVSVDGESKVTGPVNSFGYYEMIVGIPHEIKVRTLTHARIITLNYNSYLRAVTRYPNIKIQIDNYIHMGNVRGFDTLGFKPFKLVSQEETARKLQRILSQQFINVYKYNAGLSLNYWQPFKAWGKFRFFQFFLLPIVVAPNTLFIKIWSTLRIINAILIGIIAPIYFSLPNHSKDIFILFTSLQVFAVVDMYLTLHVTYYDARGLLMFHPSKTATWYLKGNFTIDLLTLFPYYWVVRRVSPPENNNPSLLYDGVGFIIVLQFYKFLQGCYYWENNILRKSEVVKILKFVPLSLIIINCATGLLVLTKCYSYKYIDVEEEGKVSRLSAEWKESINIYCTANVDVNATAETRERIFKMYLTTLYWVTQTMTGCGFGDISPQSNTTMKAIIILMVIGIFMNAYMFADLTSSMITAYVLVSKYRRRIKEMAVYLEDKNIDNNLHKRMVLHYEYNWQRTEGANPQKVFARVHASLRQSILESMYGETVQEVPEFADVGKSIIRVIGQNLDEMYFLQRETIVNYNDVLEHMYLLYRGTVQLLSKDRELIATMGSGGLFGNLSNTPFSLSSVYVIATKNVDVLRFNCNIFFKALQLSPDTIPLLKFLTSRKRDYIIPMTNPGVVSQESFSSVETIPYEMTTIRSVRPSIFATELSQAKSLFHLKNSIYKATDKCICTFAILPETILYNIIEIVIVIFAYFSSALTMYIFAFQHFTTVFLAISYALDFMFYLKIILQYRMSYFDKFGDYVVSARMIAKRYHKSKTFIYDIISNLPLEIFALAAPPSWKLPALTILRLNRTLRLGFIIQYHQLKLQTLMTNKTYLQLWWIIICCTLMCHFFTCLWYFIACPMGQCIMPCFVSEMHLEEKGKFELYAVSMYYYVLIMSTLGLSGIPIYAKRELMLSVVMMVSARFAVVLLIGTLAAAFKAQNEHLFLYQEKVSELRQNFSKRNLSEFQIRKMWRYVSSLWFYKSGRQIPKFITSAPYAMRCEVMTKMFGNHLSQSYIFAEVEKHFLRQLAIYLNRSVYFPGNYIVQQGDINHTMYFIFRGKLSAT